MTVDELREIFRSPEQVRANAFLVMQELCRLASQGIDDQVVQEIILRALDQRDLLGDAKQILDALVREVGLFPYLEEPEELGLAERIAYEFHRPKNLEEQGIVFHRPQAYVYRKLMAGESVVLSAPTSFGKSLIIDAVVASMRYNNILIVVPTIALIDETRRRLSTFSSKYKILTHPAQRLASKNILIFTQERALDFPKLERVDFFVVDEFYKLNPDSSSDTDDTRAILLNQLFYKLARRGKQFYMLGPNVTGVSPEISQRLEFAWVYEPYQTVVSEVHRVDTRGDELGALAQLCRTLKGSTIIFCKSPQRAAEVCKELIDRSVTKSGGVPVDAVSWIATHYHPEWHLVQALQHGLGVHHGRIPRALAQFVIRAFDEGWIQFLICTSTLIEGVNTKAENVIILDDRIDRKKYDFFTFNNIRGRSGRMFRHFVGHVYLFHDPPSEELPVVDIPAFSQSEAASESLLLQLDEDDLNEASKDRVKPYYDQALLSLKTLKANAGLSPISQLEMARAITDDLSGMHDALSWTGYPSYPQLEAICRFVWTYFDGARLGSSSVWKPEHLAARIWKLKTKPTTRELIQDQIERFHMAPDEAVQNVLDFLRLWSNFHFPRVLRAIGRIQREIFEKHQMSAGSFDFFANRVENYFLDSALVALDEYGIPIELGRRLGGIVNTRDDLDEALKTLRKLKIDQQRGLSSFEMDVLRSAQRYL
jgi:hypothetical protein